VLDRRFLIEEDLAQVKAEVTGLLDGLAATRPGFATRSATCSRCIR
jgi:succinyl-diaminopimelate desuccinylase